MRVIEPGHIYELQGYLDPEMFPHRIVFVHKFKEGDNDNPEN